MYLVCIILPVNFILKRNSTVPSTDFDAEADHQLSDRSRKNVWKETETIQGAPVERKCEGERRSSTESAQTMHHTSVERGGSSPTRSDKAISRAPATPDERKREGDGRVARRFLVGSTDSVPSALPATTKFEFCPLPIVRTCAGTRLNVLDG